MYCNLKKLWRQALLQNSGFDLDNCQKDLKNLYLDIRNKISAKNWSI